MGRGLLQAPKQDAEALLKRRFPVPRLVDCDQNGSQARFLLNCGIAGLLEQATIPQRAAALKLLTEHEMGELFKVIALTRGLELQPLGFVAGDRTHRL